MRPIRTCWRRPSRLDVFGLDFSEAAGALGRGEAACRQLAARARVHAGRPRFSASREEGDRLAAAFQRAAAAGDMQALTQLLATDVVLYLDGGGKRTAALNPIRGADKILRFVTGVVRKDHSIFTTTVARPADINGLPGLVLREADGSLDTVAIEHRDGRITAIYFTRNPDKLRHVRF
jgi:RNA polymerase sigma-70 factor (ECF subfamily)